MKRKVMVEFSVEAATDARAEEAVMVTLQAAYLPEESFRIGSCPTCAVVADWTHRFGRDLCPPGADTYGEGVRDCKEQVGRLIAADAREAARRRSRG